MTVKELLKQLEKEPLDAVVLHGQDGEGGRYREVKGCNFTWARKIGGWWQTLFQKTNDEVKTAVILS